jgi:hypothetical protein
MMQGKASEPSYTTNKEDPCSMEPGRSLRIHINFRVDPVVRQMNRVRILNFINFKIHPNNILLSMALHFKFLDYILYALPIFSIEYTILLDLVTVATFGDFTELLSTLFLGALNQFFFLEVEPKFHTHTKTAYTRILIFRF